MNDETTKTNQETQPEEKTVDNVELKVDEEKVAEGVFSKLANMFKNDTKNEEIKKDNTDGSEDTSKDSDTKNKESDVDIDKLVEAKAQEVISKLAYDTKKKAEAQAKSEQELNEKVSKVSEEFKELVTFKLSQDKNFDVEEYLESNPYAKIKETNTTNNVVSNSSEEIFTEEEAALLKKLNN